MAGLLLPETRDQRYTRATSFSRYQSTIGEASLAAAARGWDFAPGPGLLRDEELDRAQGIDSPIRRFRQMFSHPSVPLPQSVLEAEGAAAAEAAPRLSEAEWKASSSFRKGLKYPEYGWTKEAAEYLAERYDRRQRQDFIIANRPSGFASNAAVFGAEIAGGLVDPLSIAASFVPIVGEARFAALTARFGKTGARLIAGGVEGFAGNAALEPFVFATAQREQADYTMTDSLVNIAFGTVFGAGLHVGAGAAGDLVSRMRFKTRNTAFRKAIADVVENRPVDIGMVARSDPLFAGTSLSTRSLADQVSEVAGQIRARGARDVPDIGPVPETTAPTQSFTLEAVPQGGQRRQFTSAAEARRAQRRLEKRGENVSVEEVGANEFVLTRTSELDFARSSTGEISLFRTERAAARVIRQTQMQNAAVVPYGAPGPDRQYAIVRGATEQEIRDIRGDPARLQQGAEAAPPTDAAASAIPQDRGPLTPEFLSAFEATRRTGFDIENTPFRVEERRVRLDAANDPDERLAREVMEPRLVERPVEDVDTLDTDIEVLRSASRLTEEDEALLQAADQGVADADGLGRAYQAAAFCVGRAA